MRECRFGLMCALLMAASWTGAAALAQDAAPPEAGGTAPEILARRVLTPKPAAQVQTIVLAQLKASVPPAEEGSVSVCKVEKGTPLGATVAGESYSGSAYRMFLVEQTKTESLGVKEFYVRTTAPWKLADGTAFPAATYLSLMGGRVLLFDAAQVAAQDAAIAKSEAFCQAALDQLEQERKAKAATTAAAYQAQADKLTANVTQLTSDIAQKQAARDAAAAQVNRRLQARPPRPNQPPPILPPLTGKDDKGKLLWQFANGQLIFYDNLEKAAQDLAAARNEQAGLRTAADAEQRAVSALFVGKAQAVKAVTARERKRILAGEQVAGDDMRADYEAALGEPLKAPPAADSTSAASAAPKP